MERQEMERVSDRQHAERVATAITPTSLRQVLDDLVQDCVACRAQGRPRHDQGHQVATCLPLKPEERQRVHATMERLRQVPFDDWSGCLMCRVPQLLCNGWQQTKGPQGQRFQRLKGVRCRFHNVLVPALAMFYEFWFGSKERDWLEKQQNADPAWMELSKDWSREKRDWAWLGRKVKIGGMEANQLIRLLFLLA